MTLGAITGASVLSPQLSFFTSSFGNLFSGSTQFTPNFLEMSTLTTLGMSASELTSLADPMTQLYAGYVGTILNTFA